MTAARLTFLAIAAFWVTMNALLWRAEFGAHGGDVPVPIELIWRKILSAPDSSWLSVYQNGERTGYCELSTGVGQEMAAFDENKLVPQQLPRYAGYQLHFTGNIALDDFTNRLKFNGQIAFNAARQWRELSLKISSHAAVVEVHSVATNESAQIKATASDGLVLQRDIAFADLQNPGALARAFLGGSADLLLGSLDLPALPVGGEQSFQWNARLTRVTLGTETVPIFQVETRVLDHPVIMDVSTLGEILRIELPGGVVARIDEWKRP